MSVTGKGPDTLGGRNALIVVAVALLVLFATLGYRTTLTEHEVFAAEPAREMLAGGPLALQPFAGAIRVKKPPGQSWLIAASLLATRTQNEFTARLPSAVAGTLLALLLGAVGARLASRRVGLIAGLMTITTYGVQARARLAEADMANALAVAACFAAVLAAVTARAPAGALRPAIWFWLAMAAGIFLKGPIVLGFVAPPLVIAYAVRRCRGDRETASLIRRVAVHPLPLVLCVIVVAAWLAAALRMYPGLVEAWRHEVVDRASGEMRRDSPVTYLALLPLATLPWGPFAVVALRGGRAAWADALRKPVVLLLTLWAGAGFVLISCVALKALHYTLPILPPVILLAAVGFDRALTWSLARRTPDDRPRGRRVALVGWFGVAVGGWLGSQLFLEPLRDRGEPVKRFAADVERVVPADAPIYLIGAGEERTCWYLHRRLVQARPSADDALDAQLARLPAVGPAYVLCRVPNVAEIAARADVEELVCSEDYRRRGEDVERRALLRVRRATRAR